MMMSTSGFWNRQKHYEQLLYVLRLAFSAGLGGFIYGYYSGVIHSFHPYDILYGFENSLESTALLISFQATGSALTALFPWPRIFPRRSKEGVEPRSLATWPCPFFIVAAFLIAPSTDARDCLPVMAIMGVVTGFIFVGSTIYLAEISPTRIRGAMVATFFLQIAAGQIAYYLIGLAALRFDYSSINDDKKDLENWHWMLGTIPVLLMFILKNWLPESPNRLYALGKKEEAIEILRRTRPSVDDVVREVEALKVAVLKKFEDLDNLPFWSENMIAGIACFVAKHLVGMDIVMYHTPRIVVHVLVQYSSSKYLMLATLLIKSVLSAIGTLLCITFVDRYGRRRLLLVSTFGIITCLGFLSFMLYNSSVVAVTSASGTIGNGGRGVLGLLALGALGLYFIFYSMGIGTIPWIINAEIYPLDVRICFGITTSGTYWFIKMSISMLCVFFVDGIDQYYNVGNLFVILCLFSCMACCIVYVYALETKGYPIEEVEKLLQLEKKMSYDLKQRQVILTHREEIPYMFSSSSSDDE